MTWEGHFRRRARSSGKKRIVGAIVILAVVIDILVMWAVVRPPPEGFWHAFVPIGGAFGALGAWLLVRGVQLLRDPFRHRIFRSMGDDPATVAARLELELESAATFGKVRLTDEWLVSGSNVVRLGDVIWVYPKSTKYSVNFIPVGSIASVELHTSNRGSHNISPLSLQADGDEQALMDAIAKRAPHAFYGYRPKWKSAWLELRAQIATEVQTKHQEAAANQPI